MENASKALIMAGSILMSMLVIALLVFMYNQISDLEQSKVDAEEASKQAEYIKDIEAYNKNLYGSELLSFNNLLIEYNLNQATIKGYMPITVEVILKTEIKDKNDMVLLRSGRRYTIAEIFRGISELREDIEYYETQKYRNTGKTVKQFSQMSNLEIAREFNVSYPNNLEDYDIQDYLISSNSQIRTLFDEIQKYIDVKASEKQFKETIYIYNTEEAEFDENTGRITEMLFEEYREVAGI